MSHDAIAATVTTQCRERQCYSNSIINNKLIKKLKFDEVYFEFKFMDKYDKFPKWLMFWTITGGFILALILFNIQTKELYETNVVKGIEFFKINAILFAAYGVVISTYLTVTNTLESTRLHHEEIMYHKRKNSLDIINKWDDSLLLETRDFTREIKEKRNNISDNDLIKEIDDSDKDNKHKNLKRSIITCFNYFETIEMSIKKDLVDSDMLKEAFDDTYCSIYERFKPWLKKEGMIEETGKTSAIEKLYVNWRK